MDFGTFIRVKIEFSNYNAAIGPYLVFKNMVPHG
jgi:hypothetical protein